MESLSRGAVASICGAPGAAPMDKANFRPRLQMINIKRVGNAGGRYRAILSDGEFFVAAMLATQLNSLVDNNELQDDAIIELGEMMKNVVKDRVVVIILQLNVISNPGTRLGDAKDVEQLLKGQAAPAAAASMPSAQPLYNSTNNTGVPQETKSSNPYGGSPPSSRSNPYGGAPGNSSNTYGGAQAPVVRSNAVAGSNITPIAGLNIYNSRWTIKARITTKSDIRTWSNARGEGSLFSIELLDNSGVDIRGTFFKEGVDKFYHLLQEGKVYRISGGRLKVANAKYNNCKSSFEITFDQNTEIIQEDDAGDISRMTYDFVKIAQIEQVEPNKNIDLLAIVKSVGEVGSIISKKSGQEMAKCELILVDDSGAEISLTVWRDKAITAPQDFANNPVVAFRRARVSDYGGRSLSMGNGAQVNPQDLPEAVQLQHWWQSGGQSATATSLSRSGGMGRPVSFSERKTISAIKDENLGHQNVDKGDYLSFKGSIVFIKKDREGGAWYPACANSGEPCKNRFKVTQTTDGQWQCDKCQNTYATCVRRWIFSGVVEDGSSSTWVSFFNEQAESMLGCTADEAYEKTFGEENMFDSSIYDNFFCDPLFTDWVFKCRVKNEMVNDEVRTKTSVVSMTPVDYVQESKDLLAAIESF